MTPKDWRRNRAGCLYRVLKGPGAAVRLFEKRPGGGYYRGVWNAAARTWNRKALGTTDPAQALALGTALLTKLLTGGSPSAESPVRLQDVWERYSTTCADYLDNQPHSKYDAGYSARCLIAHFSPSCDVRTLSESDAKAYGAARRAGINLGNGVRTRPVGATSVRGDLGVLVTMLRYALTVRTTSGERWLRDYPLPGLRRPREVNVRRPLATWERFTATRATVERLAERATTDAERVRWWRVDIALVLAEATGRRLGSIRALRWEDVDFGRGTIRWRAEHDKRGVEWVVPMPDALASALQTFRHKVSAVAGWLFPGNDPAQPLGREWFDTWLRMAERRAGLPKLDGGLWHPYRRKWATERKAHPIRDVMAAGGWLDSTSLLASYQRADAETVLAVMNEPRKLSERALARG
jgi:integrase